MLNAPILGSLRSQNFFRAPARSTVTNLICLNEFVSNSFNNNNSVQAIYLDISKAFDSVNHSLLLNKLTQYGINANLINLFRNYLNNRQVIVKFEDGLSQPFIMTSGIPQGSNLSTLLFLIYINDIKISIIYSNFLLFIDDLKLFTELTNSNSLSLLQRDLSRIVQWSHKNDLDFNLSKCMAMLFAKSNPVTDYQIEISNIFIQNVNIVKDVSIIYQNNLKFNKHIESIISKAKRKLNYIKFKCRQFKNIQILLNIYNTSIKSILNYTVKKDNW